MLKAFWRRFLAERVAASVAARIEPEIDARIAQALAAQKEMMQAEILESIGSKMQILSAQKPWKKNLHIPLIGLQPDPNVQFMAHSTCCASDFLSPHFVSICETLGLPLVFHRKYWEWAFVFHHAIRTGAVAPGRRALGFAVGTEPLPSAFARVGAEVLATDAPEQIGISKGWQSGGEHAGKLEDLYNAAVVDRATFDRNVSFAACDMTEIAPHLKDYDFCWSSCSFEHLGTLKAGMDFVVESVEKTLRPGGIACHTTELNLSSDTATIEAGATVLYRKRDIAGLIDVLERRGHTVDPFSIAPDTHVLDSFVDTPPYEAPPHLKLRLLDYVSTSVGLIIRRGR